MIATSIILKILKSKYFYLCLVLIVCALYVLIVTFVIKNKNREIKELNNEIKMLEATNTLLYKDLSFKSNQIIIKEIYTNSDKAIETLENRKLNSNEIDVLNKIISDYNIALE